MKLIRFVAIVISLAMVLSIVPAFSVTVGAASATTVINSLGAAVVWNAPDSASTTWTDWTSSTSGKGGITFTGSTVKMYNTERGKGNIVTSLEGAGYASGAEKVIIEWKMYNDGSPSNLYFDFYYYDINGTLITSYNIDKNTKSVTDSQHIGYPASGTDCAIVAYNNSDGSTHTVEYYVAGSVVKKLTSVSGVIDGFGSIKTDGGYWSDTNKAVGFTDLTIAVYPAPETIKSVTATYTADGATVKTLTKTYDTSTGATSASFDAYTYAPNGGNYIYTADATTMSESGTIAMTRQANWNGMAIGDSVVYGGKKYAVTSTNLVPNGNFANGLTGWYTSAGKDASTGAFTANTDGTVHATGHTGSSGNDSLFRGWAVETGKQYIFTFTSSTTNDYLKVSNLDSVTTSDNGNVGTGVTGTNNMLFTAAEFEDGEGFLVINFRWLGSDTTLGNFGLYEVEEVIETTADTVKAGMDSLSLPLATKTSITVPTTSTDAYGYESTISWTSSNTDVLANNGTVTSPSDITIVTLTPSTTYNGSTVTGDAHTVYVFPASVAGTEFNSGAGYYDIGTTNIISAQGTNASFEGQSLAGWLAHTGQETNGAMNWVDATVDVVPDGEWAYAGWWNDPITGTNYCTIDTMWEVEAGTYYLSFYAKKPAGGSTTYVYFSEDNAHHTAVDQLTSEAWVELVSPGSDWAKYEYIITAETAGYIGFTSYNIGNNGSRGTMFDDFELYTAVQAAEDLVSITTPETVTVIAGNEPVLPTTVTGVGERGSAMTVPVEWNDANFSAAGDVTVTGTAAGFPVSMTVTVLPQTFSVDDANSPTTVDFPTDVTGDFYVEFDLLASNYDNLWIYLSKGGALWGSGQIGLGFDNAGGGGFKAQPQGNTIISTFVTNRTYRFLVHGNVDSDTYDLVVYDTVTKEVVATVDDYGFRSASDAINSIAFTPNGEGGVGTLSNIKVYAPDQADLFKSFTFVATGSVSDSYTVTATSADVVPVPHYDGHIMKTREISGTTITATYEETEYSTGSWYMRNNFTDDLWLTEGKYIGAHNAFTSNMKASSDYVDEAGVLYGDSGAKAAQSAPSSALPVSKAQSADALTLLNSGVRYFDIRLSRQEDGTIWTRHGLLSDNFRGVATTIAQWAKENPGEVLFLDFQSTYDALYTEVISSGNNGGSVGDDNEAVYNALVDLLDETGILEFSTTNWDRVYGDVTNSGTKTAIILFCKGRGASARGDIFVNRAALSGSETYCEPGTFSSVSYDTVVEAFDANYAGISAGAYIGVMHAYCTPSATSGASLVDRGTTYNAQWIDEANFEAWMGYNNGDILLMDNATSNIAEYVAKFSAYNRAGRNYSYNVDHTRTDDNVTITGAQANVPFSTKWTVEPTATTATYTIDGEEYTAVTAYELDLMQFNRDSVQPTGAVTVTFPKVSSDDTTVDVLLSADGSEVYQVAALGEAISIETASLADVILATMVAPGKEYTVNYVADGATIYTKTEVVPFGQLVYSVPAGDFYFDADTKAYILNSAEAMSHTAASDDTITTFTINVTIVSDNAVLADAFHNAGDKQPWNNDANKLFIGSSGVSDAGHLDADNVATTSRGEGQGNVGSARVPLITFNVPTVTDGKAVKLNLYVAEINGNLGVGATMKLAANVSDIEANETEGAYVAADIANLEGIVWSDTVVTQGSTETRTGVYNCDQWISIDVTEFVKAATGDTITFTLYAPTAGAYVVDREKAVTGGAYEGKAAYLEVVDAYTVTVGGASKITRNGNLVDSTDSVTAYEGAQIKLYETSSETPAFTNGTKVYATDNTTGETPYITVAGDDVYYAATVGVAPVNGAQVRIGYGVDRDGKVGTESGLRFITTVDYNNTLAFIDGAEMGVEITAEGSTAKPVVIKAEKWQDGDAKTVFTSALTNLAEGNFNRKFTATPYVTVDGQTFYGTPVTRSIYQVAAGLLVNESEDGTDYDQGALDSSVLYKVLNAYVNQTGIRLQLNSDKTGLEIYNVTDSTSNYSGDAFFEVVSTGVENNVYTITIKPAGAKTTINSYWQEYIRINNNNSQIAAYTALAENEDGSVTITFDYASFLAANAQ